MKTILLIFLLATLVISCQLNDKEDEIIPLGYNKHSVELKNDLGDLEIYLPVEFDTQYSSFYRHEFHEHNQYLTCFTPKEFGIEEDTLYGNMRSFFHSDSIYRLTITQFCTPSYVPSNYFTFIAHNYRQADNLFHETPNAKLVTNKIETINGRRISIIGYERKSKNYLEHNLTAFMIINGQPIYLDFTCFCCDCTDFIENMEKSIQTIKVHVKRDNLFTSKK
jgi:hypothetical protein